MWDWLGGLTQGQASFLGSMVGALTGLIALLLGALFNARLNRRRDDRLRREDRRAMAAALRAELAVLDESLRSHAETLKGLDTLKDPDEGFNVPDLGQQDGDRHMYAARTRFIPDAILDNFQRCAWAVAAMPAKEQKPPSDPIDISARLRRTWKA